MKTIECRKGGISRICTMEAFETKYKELGYALVKKPQRKRKESAKDS